jgi:hypothetical protein
MPTGPEVNDCLTADRYPDRLANFVAVREILSRRSPDRLKPRIADSVDMFAASFRDLVNTLYGFTLLLVT